jgi:hypothetical protein
MKSRGYAVVRSGKHRWYLPVRYCHPLKALFERKLARFAARGDHRGRPAQMRIHAIERNLSRLPPLPQSLEKQDPQRQVILSRPVSYFPFPADHETPSTKTVARTQEKSKARLNGAYLMRISMNHNDLRIRNGSSVPAYSAACRSRTRKIPPARQGLGRRPGNASWGYSRPWLGHGIDSAETGLGLIEFLLSLVLSRTCLGTLGRVAGPITIQLPLGQPGAPCILPGHTLIWPG